MGFYNWATGQLAAGKCYLQLPPAMAQSAPRFILLPGDDTPTNLDEIFGADDDAPYYDLQGREVKNPEPGIYVRRGQKVVVK